MKPYSPSLPRRAAHWKYDLSKPNDQPALCKSAILLRTPPNQANKEFLELPRSTLAIRGAGYLGGGLGIIIATSTIILSAYIKITSNLSIEIISTLIELACFCMMYWLSILLLRTDIELPRDEPIRFNRLQRKVYFYQYRFDRLRIFSRDRWGVKPVAYDWDDLIAEVCSVYAPMGNGGLIENVMIAVRKPGTEEIIDRLFFTHDIELGKKYWAIAQLFMQQGPEALPVFVNPPRDWNNDAEISFIRRLAPKVKWPEAMDLESRTAPAKGETP